LAATRDRAEMWRAGINRATDWRRCKRPPLLLYFSGVKAGLGSY
jgi:hypothetical protein